ncbi:hypothetical protein GW17_00045787, partial [Ensete ventricosum]
MSFYNECYRTFVPEIFTASIAYHVVVLLHTISGPRSEVRVLFAAVMACRPYPCQVSRKIVRLHACVRSAPLCRVGHAGDLVVQGRGDMAARSIPPQEDL